MSALADDVVALVQLFQESDLRELLIERGERKLLLRRGEQEVAPLIPEVAPAPAQVALVKAHMVGVFYWSRDKVAKPAVTLGQALSKGQVVGFVEAMGIMNELEAPQAGRIVEFAVASGQPVEFGQPILVLQPD